VQKAIFLAKLRVAPLPRKSWYTAGDELEEWQRAEDMMDVYECAAAAPALKPHESAIVFTNNLARSTVLGLEQPIKLAAQLQSLGIDTVFVAPAAGSVKWKHDSERYSGKKYVRSMLPTEVDLMKRYNVKTRFTPWATPPGLLTSAEACAESQMLKLHVFNLTEWKSVLYVDSDVSIIDATGIQAMLRCAATGRLLCTRGSTGAPVNFGMFATATDENALLSAAWFASKAHFTKANIQKFEGGWDNTGAWPFKGPFAGYGCDQGFVWTFFYGNGLSIARNAFNTTSHLAKAARVIHKFHLIPHVVDRCTFNYQRESGSARRTCAQDFECAHVVMIHKHHTLAAQGPRKMEGQSFKDEPRRKGVCGCNARYFDQGWKNDTCDKESLHEMVWP